MSDVSQRTQTAGSVGAHSSAPGAVDVEEETGRPLTELVADLGRDIGDLLSTQVQLATVEVREEVQQAARTAQLVGIAAGLAVLAVLLASFAAAWGLAEVMPEGVAFLIVAAVYGVVAAVAYQRARRALDELGAPETTMQTIKEDVEWVRRQTS